MTAAVTTPAAGEHPPQPGMHLAAWASELAGTAILVLGGLSAVCLDFGHGSPVAPLLPSVSARLLLTGLLFAGVGSLVAISPLGRCSGGHINPSVTVAFWITGHVHRHDLAGYVGAQCLGALLGAILLRWLWGPVAVSVHDGMTAPQPGTGPWAAVGIEALMTAILVLTILLCVARARTARWTPLAVWVVVALLVWQGAPYTGTSLNPARSLGPALVGGTLSSLWVYWVGPLAGAALLAGGWRLLGREWQPVTAKLFHDHRYQSVLRSRLPVRGRR